MAQKDWTETASIADDLRDFFNYLGNPEGPVMDRFEERVRDLEKVGIDIVSRYFPLKKVGVYVTCERCHYTLDSRALPVGDDGRFEMKSLPECNNKLCSGGPKDIVISLDARWGA